MAEENKEDSLELSEETINEELSVQEEASDGEKKEDGAADSTEQIIEENPEFVKKKKPNILKLALFGVIGLLGLVLITGVILYFTGFFDAPEQEKPMMDKKDKVQKVIEKEEPKFSLKDINTKNLNKQLAELTNKSIKEQQEEERIKKLEEEKKLLEEEKKKQQAALAQEEEKLAKAEENLLKERETLKAKQDELNKQKQILDDLREEALLLKEEMIKQREAIESQTEEKILAEINKRNQEMAMDKKEEKPFMPNVNTDENSMMQNDMAKNDNNMPNMQKEQEDNTQASKMQNDEESPFLLLINVAKIKGNLYKDYLDSIISISSDVKLCRDDSNNIEIYFGPFDSMESRSSLYNKLIENKFENSYEVELTKEEFNKRCNY